mgnify:CR=1 FL=1
MADSGAGQDAGEGAARAGGLPGAVARGDALVELLGKEVGTLLPAEGRLARAVALGELCDAATEEGDERLTKDSKPDASRQWGAHRTVRAEVLRAICTRREAHDLADPRGIRLRNAAVTGRLDLQGAVVPFDIWLVGCAFDETIIARGRQSLVGFGRASKNVSTADLASGHPASRPFTMASMLLLPSAAGVTSAYAALSRVRFTRLFGAAILVLDLFELTTYSRNRFQNCPTLLNQNGFELMPAISIETNFTYCHSRSKVGDRIR